MTRVSLKHIIGRQAGAGPMVAALADALGGPVTVADASGRTVFGVASDADRFPVTHDGKDIGSVSGHPQAGVIAHLLQFLAGEESERKSLGAEVLHLYREVNLIYSFSEKLAALLDLERVAALTLQEARHLIVATDGVILLLDDDTGALSSLAAFGDELPALSGLVRGTGIIGSVVATGVGEIVNDVVGDARRVQAVVDIRSLVCAPLKVGEKVIGAIALASTLPMAYEARELKLLSTLALQSATAIENARLFERTVQAAEERERLLALNQAAEVTRAGYERELELAARIQVDLFPAALPSLAGYDVAAQNRPAKRCGGDYYDALPAADGAMLFCVADVSGKGLPASLLMSHMQATLRALLGRTSSITELAAQASDLLHASTAGNKYVTAAMLELEPASGAARYVSAGHISSWLVRHNGDVLPLESTGAPLGLLPPGLPYDELRVELAPGDVAVLCSDGVTDAQNESGEEFGEERPAAIVTAARLEGAGALVSRVFDAIDAFAGDAPQFDDITMLVVRRLGPP
jgi:serine phosphatase RsbU (regulator of sigma subunit)